MSDQSTDTVRGLSVIDHGDGSVTVSRSGTATSAAFSAWLGAMKDYPEVGKLVRDLVEGRRGKEGQYRPVTVESVKFRPTTLLAARVPISTYDTGGYAVSAVQDWS